MDSNYTIDWSKEFSYRIYSSGGGEETSKGGAFNVKSIMLEDGTQKIEITDAEDFPTLGEETLFYGKSIVQTICSINAVSEEYTNDN